MKKNKKYLFLWVVSLVMICQLSWNASAAGTEQTNTGKATQETIDTTDNSKNLSLQNSDSIIPKKIQIKYTPGEVVDISHKLFENEDLRLLLDNTTAEADGFGEITAFNSVDDTIRLVMPYVTNVKNGIYKLKLEGTIVDSDNVVVDKGVYDDIIELVVENDIDLIAPNKVQITYNPGETVTVSHKLFENENLELILTGKTAEIEEIGEIEAYNGVGDAIHIKIPYDKDVKKGTYKLKLSGTIVDTGNDNVIVDEGNYDNLVELVVEEDMKGVHLINTEVNFDGTKDAVFRFQNGTGKNRIVKISDSIFWAKQWEEEDGDEITTGFGLSDSEIFKDYYTYDLDKGEYVIKKEFFKSRVDEYGWVLKPWVFYGGIDEFTLANGQTVHLTVYHPQNPTLTKDFVNPGRNEWYFLYNVKDTGGSEISDPVERFVERLYINILQRDPDKSGLDAWTNVLKSGKEQGAKVAQGFIESDEFKSRNISDKEYLEILYQTFFDREADTSGLNGWLSVLDSGLSRMHVFRGFAESSEFTKVCGEYGIIRGNVTLTAPMDQNEGVTKFVARCYKLCLGRNPDSDGLNGWCSQILSGKNTAKVVAQGFVFSAEFKNKNLSNEEFVKTMYSVFMDREADAAGLNAWINVLNGGQSREHVFNGFADSEEFKGICQSYGII